MSNKELYKQTAADLYKKCDELRDSIHTLSGRLIDAGKQLEKYQWVSVKDRMPKSGDTVLVLWDDRYLYNGNEIHNRRIQTAICCNEDIDTKCFVADDTYYTEVINVTHWMPLPEPPKEDATR